MAGERGREWNYRERKREGRQQNHERQRDPEGQRESNTTPPGWGLRCTPPRLFRDMRGLPGDVMTTLHPQYPPDRAGGLGTTTHSTQLPIAIPGAGRTTKQVSGLLPLQQGNASFRGSPSLWDPPNMCFGPSATPQTPPLPVIRRYVSGLCAFETKSQNRSEPLGGPE